MHALMTQLMLLAMVAHADLLGEKAPDFKAMNQDGKMISLSDYKGKPVLLYFYPKDDTPGCTVEACKIRDGFAKFKKLGITVFGVSRQGQKSHLEFRKKHSLPFDLLVDKDGALAKLYGIDKIMLVGFFKRQSVLIGADGVIHKIYRDVDPDTHADTVLKDTESLVNGLGK